MVDIVNTLVESVKEIFKALTAYHNQLPPDERTASWNYPLKTLILLLCLGSWMGTWIWRGSCVSEFWRPYLSRWLRLGLKRCWRWQQRVVEVRLAVRNKWVEGAKGHLSKLRRFEKKPEICIDMGGWKCIHCLKIQVHSTNNSKPKFKARIGSNIDATELTSSRPILVELPKYH